MTIFDRHIIRRLLTTFIFLIAGLVVFFIVLHYVEYIDDFMDRGATMREVFGIYYPSYIPEIIKLTSPLAIFLASVYLTGRLAQELQIAALQTSGISLYRLLRPYLLVALLITGFMFWFNGWIVPSTNRTVLSFESRYLNDSIQQTDVADIFRQNRPGSVISVGFYDKEAQTGHRVSLQNFQDSRHLDTRIDAVRMEWIDSLSQWRMYDVVVRDFSEPGLQQLQKFKTLDTLLNVYPRDFARTERDVESMSIPEAEEYVASLRRSGVDNMGRTLVGYYSKFSYPFANLILILLAVPLASVRRRGGQAIQIGLGLLTAFLYLAVMKLTEPFGYAGAIPPLLVSWLPHIIFFFAAIVLLIKARK